MVELELGIGPVRQPTVGRRLDEPRIPPGPHHPRELPGDDPPRIVHQFFRQHDRRGEVVAHGSDRAGDRRQRGPVAGLRERRIETGGGHGPPRQHDVMPQRMVIRGMRERPTERPEVTPLRQQGQMLADLQPRGVGVDGLELAANFRRGLWLHVKAVVLPQAARQEDVDHRPGFPGRAPHSRPRFPQRGEVVGSQAQQADGSRLHGEPTRHPGMLRRRKSITSQCHARLPRAEEVREKGNASQSSRCWSLGETHPKDRHAASQRNPTES